MDLVAHLRAFVAVAETGGFTRAAEVCACPQPVVSRRVAALERRYGRLFTRSTRSVQLTGLGRDLLPHATDLVTRADRLDRLATSHAPTVSIGIPSRGDPRGLAAARAAAATAGWSVTFVEGDPVTRTEAQRQGVTGMAILACPDDEAELSAELGAGTPNGSDRSTGLAARPTRRRP